MPGEGGECVWMGGGRVGAAGRALWRPVGSSGPPLSKLHCLCLTRPGPRLSARFVAGIVRGCPQARRAACHVEGSSTHSCACAWGAIVLWAGCPPCGWHSSQTPPLSRLQGQKGAAVGGDRGGCPPAVGRHRRARGAQAAAAPCRSWPWRSALSEHSRPATDETHVAETLMPHRACASGAGGSGRPRGPTPGAPPTRCGTRSRGGPWLLLVDSTVALVCRL